jgi:bifunctional lysine-specific demethylase and histidyl-hydroxylase NO66
MTGRPDAALERCVGDSESFLTEIWGRRPSHHVDRTGFEDLLTLDAVDHMLTSMSLRLPSFRLVRDGTTIPTSTYTRSGRIGSAPVSGLADAARIFQLFEQGATLVLQGMHRFWPPAADLCRDLEMTLGHPTQVNAYITPPGSRGLAVHRDSHDVFVLQAFGSKRWEVWEPGDRVEDPMPTPAIGVELHPGETLYVPKGSPHAARTQEAVSGHLTVGILSRSWMDIVGDVLNLLGDEPSFQEALPAGFHRERDRFRSATEERLHELARAVEKIDPALVAEGMVRRFLTTRPPLMRGALGSILAARSVQDDTPVRRRDRALCEVADGGDRLLVYLGDRELRMPSWVEPAMRFVAGRTEFHPKELAPMLDEGSRLVLVRRLVREGLLEPAPTVVG